MKKFPELWFVVLVALCFVSTASASVNMKLTDAGNNVASTTIGSLYVNPYTATIDGVSASVICDDFGDDTYLNQTWKADVYTVAQAVTTGLTRDNQKYGGPTGFDAATLTTKYTEMADLAIQLLATPAVDTNTRTAISFALWGVFDTTSINTLSNASIRSSAETFLSKAIADYGTRGQSGNDWLASTLTIYSPIAGTSSVKPGPPQEFITVKTPEASAVALVAFDFGGLGLLFMFARRYQQNRKQS